MRPGSAHSGPPACRTCARPRAGDRHVFRRKVADHVDLPRACIDRSAPHACTGRGRKSCSRFSEVTYICDVFECTFAARSGVYTGYRRGSIVSLPHLGDRGADQGEAGAALRRGPGAYRRTIVSSDPRPCCRRRDVTATWSFVSGWSSARIISQASPPCVRPRRFVGIPSGTSHCPSVPMLPRPSAARSVPVST